MDNTSTDFAEYRYEAYEKYLANKRLNVAPMLGTNVCLATITLGLTEAPTPYAGEYTNSFETYSQPLGETALTPLIRLDSTPTPREALRAQQLALAA